MVRGVADRAFLPAKSLLEEVGDMMILTGKTIMSALRPPYPYGGEFVQQFLFALKLCWFPLVVSTVAFGYGAPGLQAANFLVLFGALDRLGGFFVLASIREFAPFVTAIVLAGVAGTAITADLGARKIREELDALQVLGVDPVKNLVVPRFLALMLVTGLFDIYALLFGIFGGIARDARQRRAARPVLGDVLHQRLGHGPLGVGPQVHDVRRDHRDRLLLQGHDRVGRRRGGGPGRQPGGRHRHHGRLRVQLRVHADAARDPSRDHGDQVNIGWLSVPRDWIASFGEIVKFCSRIVAEVFTLKVLRFFGEALRQAGILILSSTIVIWGLIFIIGLQCGIEGAYFNRSVGSPAYAGVFAAWCDLRELVPYAFGYMMSAKIGTGIVAELGSMRISDEIDALEVMGIPSLTFLCATKLLGGWLVLPFMYLAGIGAGFFASYLAVVQQIGEVSQRRLLPDLLDVPEPTRPLIQRDKGHDDGHGHRARRLLLRLQRRAAARSAWAPRPRSRWCSTSCSCTSSACWGRSSSGARTHGRQSEVERRHATLSDDTQDPRRAATAGPPAGAGRSETQPREQPTREQDTEERSPEHDPELRAPPRAGRSATATPTTSTSGTRARSARPACRTRSSSSRCTRRSAATRSCAA